MKNGKVDAAEWKKNEMNGGWIKEKDKMRIFEYLKLLMCCLPMIAMYGG